MGANMNLNFKKVLITAALWTMAIIAATRVLGCTNNTSKELLIIEIDRPDGIDVKLTYRPEWAQWSLLSITGVEDSEHITPLSSTCTGKFTTQPDPNSIDSAGGMLERIITGLLK